MRTMLFALLALTAGVQTSATNEFLLYAGTYTNGDSRGIYAFRFDAHTGATTSLGLAATTPNPSFLALHPNGLWLYAVNEQTAGSVSAFSIDRRTGKLTLLNSVPSGGAGPCHLAVDHTGRWVAVANYNSGSVSIFPIHPDGRLGEASTFVQLSGSSVHPRQQGPHAHQVVFSSDNGRLSVTDLGADQVTTYRFDPATGRLAEPDVLKTPPGSGPRHLVFTADGRDMFLLNELSNIVIVYRDGKPVEDASTLPDGFTERNTAAELALDPSGRMLYVSNRGADDIAMFRVDGSGLRATGRVSTGGRGPRHFALDPAGTFLLVANQGSSTIVSFRREPTTGALTRAGSPISVPVPVCLVFTPARL